MVSLQLPTAIAKVTHSLFDAHPIERAMEDLVVHAPPATELVELVESAVDDPAVGAESSLAAGLWLYIGELDRSHAVSQAIPDATGAFWHGIMHRREGDFGNSHYWFRRVGHHPAMDALESYNPHAFIDAVSHRHVDQPGELVALQREEWKALFTWCAYNRSDPV